MIEPAFLDLADFLKRRLEGGSLVIYGRPGSLRTRAAFLLCRQISPSLYLGTGRHARIKKIPSGVQYFPTTSFYEELLKVIEIVGLCRRGAVKLAALDEFLANVVPYRASLSEAYVARMALTEVNLLRVAREAGCSVVVVCAEDRRTGGPLALKVLRQLKPKLIRLAVENGTLAAEERDVGDPLLMHARVEVPLEAALNETL